MARRRNGRALGLLLATVSLAAGGCGDDASRTEPRRAPVEVADPRPELPSGWRRVVNRRAGFNLGLPPGWTVGRAPDRGTLLRSPDHLVAVSISADRTEEALRLELATFAIQILDGLPGFRDLDRRPPERIEARYDAVSVEASGRAIASGVRQRLVLIVLRRRGIAAYPMLVAANARIAPHRHDRTVARILETFRSQPVEARPPE